MVLILDKTSLVPKSVQDWIHNRLKSVNDIKLIKLLVKKNKSKLQMDS